jgi:hypothetical protein
VAGEGHGLVVCKLWCTASSSLQSSRYPLRFVELSPGFNFVFSENESTPGPESYDRSYELQYGTASARQPISSINSESSRSKLPLQTIHYTLITSSTVLLASTSRNRYHRTSYSGSYSCALSFICQ